MDPRLETLEAFRAAIAGLRLPITEDEIQTAWAMARDLRSQADGLRDAIQHMRGSRHLTAPLEPKDQPGGARRG
jgi:hypothetical protein